MKEKGIKILFSVFLFASILMPFSVSAETVGGSSPIIGVNITYVGYDGEVVPYQTTVHFDTEQTMWRCTSSHSTMGCQVWESITSSGSDLDEITGTITTNATSSYTYRLYQYEFIFDKPYVGSITFNGNHPGATTTTTYYVNGDRLILTDVNLVTSFTIGSYNLTYAPQETITRLRQWNFPIESFSFVYKMFANGLTVQDINDFYYYSYPLFNLPANSELIRSKWSNATSNYDQVLIFGVNRNIFDNTSFQNFFTLNNVNVKSLNVLYREDQGSNVFTIVKVLYNTSSSSSNYCTFIPNNDYLFMPIFNEYYSARYSLHISTDFALVFSLSNELLDNLNIIAQGTQQSNSAASGLESSNSTMASDMNSMATIENGYSQDFNSQLQNIDFTNPIQQNQGIVPAANFVISIFNGLISSNPFSVLIIIVCILLIGKKVIGK